VEQGIAAQPGFLQASRIGVAGDDQAGQIDPHHLGDLSNRDDAAGGAGQTEIGDDQIGRLALSGQFLDRFVIA
jgi:hypothetical protein